MSSKGPYGSTSGRESGAPCRSTGAGAAARLLGLFGLALIALFATAAPAGAAAPTTTTPAISAVSYASAHVTGRITTTGGLFKSTDFNFQYSKNPGTEGWTSGPVSSIGNAKTNETVESDITGLRGATKYFVRLVATVYGPGFVLEEGVSPEPNPSFTTLTIDPPENVSISAPSKILSTSAELSGKVKRPANADSSFDVKCHYEYVSQAQFDENVTNHGSGAGFSDGATVTPCVQNPISEPTVEKVVTAHIGCLHPTSHEEAPYYDLPCLEAATTYHVRLVAENSAPGTVVAENTFTTLPMVAKAVVLAANDATDVSYKTAKVSGSIERPGGVDPALDVYCYFEYVTNAQFETTAFTEAVRIACDQTPREGYGNELPLTATGPTPVTATLHLSSGVEYRYRLTAENGGGVDTRTVAGTIATTPGGEPTIATDPKPVIGYTSFEVFGNVTHGLGAESEAEELFYQFEFAEVGTENWNGCCGDGQVAPPGAGPKPVSYEYSPNYGIKPDTEYKYRLVLFRGYFEYSAEPYPTVKTKALAKPSVAFDPVTGVTLDAAHFSGSVDTNAPGGALDELTKAAFKTEWEFQCTPECPGNSGTIESEEGSKAISLEAQKLQPNTFYEARLVAHNSFYTVESPAQNFQTPLIPPSVTALPGASDGQGGYFLEGIVDSHNTKVTSCKFEYGTTATYPNTYEAPCLPSPSGPDEVQLINVEATEGQFKLSFRGQTTGDLPFNATPAEVQAALRALSKVGSNGVNVSGIAQAYKVTFVGPLAGTNVSQIKGSDGSTPLGGGAGVSGSTETEGGNSHPVSVEAHLEALTIDAIYHFRIVATSAGGTTTTADHIFIPELASKEVCANEQEREENGSLALPECRAYEMVSPPGKEGYEAGLMSVDGGAHVAYTSVAGNIAKSGQNGLLLNYYVAERTAGGWKTIPDLNGSSGSLYDAPSNVVGYLAYPLSFSPDLLSAVWLAHRKGEPEADTAPHAQLRRPDGTFALIGNFGTGDGLSTPGAAVFSADLSHLVTWGEYGSPSKWGPGVYEFLGTGMDQPRRVDLDNSGTPVSSCNGIDVDPLTGSGFVTESPAHGLTISGDGDTVLFKAYGVLNAVPASCGAGAPPANEIWARVDGTTSFDVSASHCDRVAPACNAPSAPTFVALRADGSRVFFTSTQQLVNDDTDQTVDIYACDLPSGNPVPTAGKSNPCSAFRQISVAESGAAEVENVLSTSEDGSTVLFTAKGVLATNEDALEEEALAGANNLYVWHQDSAHPAGQTLFVGRLELNDLSPPETLGGNPEITPDGRYVVFTTANQLLEIDTDSSRDAYRLDAETGELIRVSTNILGVGGNRSFDTSIPREKVPALTTGPAKVVRPAISDDGQKIVFTTTEALSPNDGNAEPDVYLWTPARVSLVSTGSAGAAPRHRGSLKGVEPTVAIAPSGEDVYFETSQPLTPADGDGSTDVYDARVGGGFSFAEPVRCAGEACQPGISNRPASESLGSQGAGPGNPPAPKPCPKGKVRKHGKCVKKNSAKKHSSKKHPAKKHHKRASSNSGGGK